MLVRVIKIYRSLFHRAEEERDSTMSVLDPLLSTCFLPQSHFLFLLSFQISLFLRPVPILSRQHSKINKEIFLIHDIFSFPKFIILEFHFIDFSIASTMDLLSPSLSQKSLGRIIQPPILLKSHPPNNGGTRKFPKIIGFNLWRSDKRGNS